MDQENLAIYNKKHPCGCFLVGLAVYTGVYSSNIVQDWTMACATSRYLSKISVGAV